LQVSKAHLSNVINGKVRGVAPVRSIRLGRRILIKREWIEDWLETANHGNRAKESRDGRSDTRNNFAGRVNHAQECRRRVGTPFVFRAVRHFPGNHRRT